MKYCRNCGRELIVGENWTVAKAKARSYICKECLADKCQEEKEARKAHRDANKKHRAKIRRAYHEANKERAADLRFKRRFNFSLAEYDAMLEIQGGGCAICGKTPEEEGRRLAVDHNHETGKVCGLLCGVCNKALGGFQDDSAVVQAALLYLQKGGR